MTMRKWCLFLGTYFALCLLAACAGTEPVPAGEDLDSVTTELAEYPTLSCRIVDGAEEGSLLLADRNGSGVYRVTVTEDTPVTLDGEPASAADLEDGMPIAIAYDGTILETYPAQLGEVYEISAYSLGTEQNPGGGYYDLCGLYLQVLEDLWEADSGLNSASAWT